MNTSLADLESKTRDELQEMAKEMGIPGNSALKRQELVFRLLQTQTEQAGFLFGGGVLEIVEDGYGFLRKDGFLPGPSDVYVSQSQIRRFALRTGDMVTGQVRPPKENEKYYGMAQAQNNKNQMWNFAGGLIGAGANVYSGGLAGGYIGNGGSRGRY